MKKLEIIAKCSNCKHCHATHLSDTYVCSKGMWHNKHYTQDICKDWNPTTSDMKLWVERETAKGRNHEIDLDELIGLLYGSKILIRKAIPLLKYTAIEENISFAVNLYEEAMKHLEDVDELCDTFKKLKNKVCVLKAEIS